MHLNPCSVEWFSNTVYGGGGKKAERATSNGTIRVNANGSLEVSPDDDYYGGTISSIDAKRLAVAILERIKS